MTTQQVIISASPEQVDILLAELGEIHFDIFEDSDTGLIAYCQTDLFNSAHFKEVITRYEFLGPISFQINEIEKQNWNAVWESNYDPIRISNQVFIRANFHESEPGYAMEIVINPKMSFGTGHHETTHMVIQHLLETDLVDKKTLDMGCGTAILAILAEMKGAKPIDAIDIDNWCYLNSIENAERNNCKHISVYEGDASLLVDQKYDVIIANINRNILLNDMYRYVNCLNQNGLLFLSGFYQEDIPAIDACCQKLGLKLEKTLERNNWVSLKYQLG